MESFKKRSRSLPALVVVLGISLTFGFSVWKGQPGQIFTKMYLSVQPPEIVSNENVFRVTDVDIDEFRFLTIGGKYAKVVNRNREEFFVYISHDGILFSPLYLTGSEK